MDPYQQQQQQQQQQLMAAAFGMGMNNGYHPPPPLPNVNTSMPGVTTSGMSNNLPSPPGLMNFGRPPPPPHFPQYPGSSATPAISAPVAQTPSMPLPPPVRRGGAPSSMTVRAPKGMHRPQPKPGHTAKKNDGKFTGPWSQKEHQQFEKSVIIHGWGNWVQVSSKVPGRTKDQCKSHAQKFAKHHPVEKARLDREHIAYCRLQSSQRHSYTANRKVPVIHNKATTQLETLPAAAPAGGMPSLPPVPKFSDSPTSSSSPPAKKKVRTGHKLPLRTTVAVSEESQTEGLPSSGKKQTETAAAAEEKKDEAKTSMSSDEEDNYEEPLPTPKAITPPTKTPPKPEVNSKEQEARELLAMSNSMSADAKQKQQKSRRLKPSERYAAMQKEKAEKAEAEAASVASKSPSSKTPSKTPSKSPSFAHVTTDGGQGAPSSKSPSFSNVSSEGTPRVAHKPDNIDPDSIDTICAQIHEQKQQNGRCVKFPLCLCNQIPCANKNLTSSVKIKKTSYFGSL